MEGNIKIHLFTSERPEAGEASLLSAFLRAGLDYLHIRRPQSSEKEIRELLDNLPSEYGSRIILHDYPALAAEYGCGFQLTGRTPAITGEITPLSRSCHSVEEVMESGDLDFVTLSPIYDSISKPGYTSAFSRALPVFDRELMRKTVALGGVDFRSLPELERAGFGGAALLGAVWNSESGRSDLLKYLRLRNLPLQFITDGRDADETVAQAMAVLEGGGKWIQVRLKEGDRDTIRGVLERLLPEVEKRAGVLIVDDHYELTEYCHGVHLGQNDAPVAEVRKMIPEDKIIGLTVNTSAQIADSLSALPDYYGVGPFRYTSTKKNLAPVLGLEGYERLHPQFPRKYVAIGGITPDDIPSLLQAGVPGIAVSGIINRAADPVEMTRRLLEIIKMSGPVGE